MPVQRFQLSPAIEVCGLKGRKLADATEMPPKEGKTFVKNVRDAYAALAKLQTGSRLLSEMNLSGHTCTIYCSEQDGAAMADPPDIPHNVARMVKSFRPQHHNMLNSNQKSIIQRVMVDGNEEQRRVKGPALAFMKKELTKLNQLEKKSIASMELDYILARAWGSLEAGRRSLVSLLSKSRSMVDAMCDGEERVDDNDYLKICIAFYAHLTPGPGCDTQVKLVPKIRVPSANGSFEPKKDPDAVPKEIMLGHELIHAWRMMVGRRIVNDGWEEEAMTTGIGPFGHLPMTENRLRSEAGYPKRTAYRHPIFNSAYTKAIAEDPLEA